MKKRWKDGENRMSLLKRLALAGTVAGSLSLTSCFAPGDRELIGYTDQGFPAVKSLTCNEVVPRNGIVQTDYTYLRGVKTQFNVNEPITFVAFVYHCPGSKLNFQLTRENGELLKLSSQVVPSDSYVHWIRATPGKLPTGSLTSSWYINGQNVSNSALEIVDAPGVNK